MTDVPSNLIPTRITELPEYSGTATNGYAPYAIDGRTYKATLANIVAPLADDVAIAAAAAEAAKSAAQGYKFEAADSAEAAAASANYAEAMTGPTYASTAAGLAATSSGQGFAVDNGDGTVTVYLNSSGTAVLQRTLLTPARLAEADGASLVGSNDGAGGSLWTTVAGFISRLMSSAGSSFIGFIQSGTGAVARTVQAKLRDTVSIKDFGALGDGVTDDTIAVQAAVNSAITGGASLYVPSGTYRLTSAITINGGIRILGDGNTPYVGSLATVGTRGAGSWFYIDHTGRGFTIAGSNAISGIEFEKVGTYRNQPTPAPAWTPNAHDYDIHITNADVLLHDVTLLNPTKGVYLAAGSYGRLEIDTLRGQAFQRMIEIDESYDVVKINNLHQWPFWSDNTNVHTYTLQNLDVVRIYRCDNPKIVNLFSIFANSTIRFSQNAAGKCNKAKIINFDSDRGKLGVWIDSTVTTGVSLQCANFTHQGETGVANSQALKVDGNNSVSLSFINFRTDLCDLEAIKVAGTGNTVLLAGALELYNYNQSATGLAALDVATDNTVRINGYPQITGGGVRYSGAGFIYVDEWRNYTPTVTAGTGTLTTVSATGRFKLYGNTCSVLGSITITTNGTGGQDVRMSLPVAASGSAIISSLYGREGGVSGAALQGIIGISSSEAVIYKYDNSYPGANGASLSVAAKYQVA